MLARADAGWGFILIGHQFQLNLNPALPNLQDLDSGSVVSGIPSLAAENQYVRYTDPRGIVESYQ